MYSSFRRVAAGAMHLHQIESLILASGRRSIKLQYDMVLGLSSRLGMYELMPRSLKRTATRQTQYVSRYY